MTKLILITCLVLLSASVGAQVRRALPYGVDGYYTDGSGCMTQSAPSSDGSDSSNGQNTQSSSDSDDDDDDDGSPDGSNGQATQPSSVGDCVYNTYGSGGNVIRTAPRAAEALGTYRR
ncbi:hypothetical protein [Polynucleobacter necessarius]|uniref:hypothetical protein n=1 Tax=Polynucleobacter necessarius TaxID=576610 RepID=UPI000E090C6B|nr:hypothetical protein [Polynucleobacter necessarius]